MYLINNPINANINPANAFLWMLLHQFLYLYLFKLKETPYLHTLDTRLDTQRARFKIVSLKSSIKYNVNK